MTPHTFNRREMMNLPEFDKHPNHWTLGVPLKHSFVMLEREEYNAIREALIAMEKRMQDAVDALNADTAQEFSYKHELRRAEQQRDEHVGQIAAWATSLGFATGHADTLDDLLAEIGAQVVNSRQQRDEIDEQLTVASGQLRYMLKAFDELAKERGEVVSINALRKAIAKAGEKI